MDAESELKSEKSRAIREKNNNAFFAKELQKDYQREFGNAKNVEKNLRDMLIILLRNRKN